MGKQKVFGINSFILHLIAMTAMLIDHMYHTLYPDKLWMNGIGRVAFPIFAFMIVEGYYHTKDVKKYMLRLFIFAIISEIPFDLMAGGRIIDMSYQNVMWTFLVALIGLVAIDKIKESYKDNNIIKIFGIVGVIVISFLVATILITDYFGFGVLTVFVFYFFREKNIKNLIIQIILLYIINNILLASVSVKFANILDVPIVVQCLALFSLIFIWNYNGERGYYNNFIKYCYYLFYPIHMLVLWLISVIIYYPNL